MTEIEIPALENPVLPKAKKAKVIYTISRPSDFSEKLSLASIQGILARKSDEQVLISAGASGAFIPYIKKTYGCSVKSRIDGKAVTVRNLAEKFKDNFNGYILCSFKEDSESVNVALSLAGVLECMIATNLNKKIYEQMGLECVLDVSDKDDKWLRESEYRDKISKKIAVEQPSSMASCLGDYAIMCGAYFNYYDGRIGKEHKAMYDHLDANAVVFGYNNDFGEFDTVNTLSEMNVQLVPSDHASNLSTLSGFTLTNAEQKTAEVSDGKIENVHTVCFILSDGDNMQWIINDYSTTDRWFNSPHRGSFNMGWGLPTASGDMIAPMVSYLYDKMTEKDEFIMQLSGIGYTFPSKWDKEERKILASNTAKYMQRTGLRYMEILDSEGFKASVLEDFTAEEAIEGFFYIDYSNYAGEKGKIIWTNDKPTVSARYRLWAGTESSDKTLPGRINKGSTDVTSEDAYSFVIVHAWSGMKDGKFGADGSSIEAVKAVIDKLDDHVEVVTPSEFMKRIKENVKHD